MLPGGSPLKPHHPKGRGGAPPAMLNGTTMHPRQASAGDGGALFGGGGGPLDRQQLSLAAAAAWGPAGGHSTHSSLDSAAGGALAAGGGGQAVGKDGMPAGAGPAASGDSSEALLPGLGRYPLADGGSTADSWQHRRQLV